MQVGMMGRGIVLPPAGRAEIRLDDANDRLQMPVPSWWPILRNSSIPHCLSELIARFPGDDNGKQKKKSKSAASNE
jgi:hypothetical protein